MTTLILVHPGSVFTSARSQIDPRQFEACVDGMEEALERCTGLVVIDGSLSDGIPAEFDKLISARLADLASKDCPALRVWGCDSGEPPYPAWRPFGDVEPVHDGQEAAAAAVAPQLYGEGVILCTGAWATRDDSGGCVNSVRDEIAVCLRVVSPVFIDRSAVFEDYLEWGQGDPVP